MYALVFRLYLALFSCWSDEQKTKSCCKTDIMGRSSGAVHRKPEPGFHPRPRASLIVETPQVSGADGVAFCPSPGDRPCRVALTPLRPAVTVVAVVSPDVGASLAGCHRIVPRLRLPPTPVGAEMGAPGCAPRAAGGAGPPGRGRRQAGREGSPGRPADRPPLLGPEPGPARPEVGRKQVFWQRGAPPARAA